MRRFAQVPRRSWQPVWNWALAAAAVALLSIGLGVFWSLGHGAGHGIAKSPASRQGQVASASFDAVAGDDGFVDIAYAPPLAAGEFVSVVRTELQPTALARMGIYVDADYANAIPADVMVGEDGVPRAVRLVSEEFEN